MVSKLLFLITFLGVCSVAAWIWTDEAKTSVHQASTIQFERVPLEEELQELQLLLNHKSKRSALQKPN
jgi:hypothetical protein